MGFFERAGTLGPGESARLDFDAAEMNDVLKSLTIDERGGGKISGLRYDSLDPLSHTLAQFPFQIGGAQPLSGMLDQLKGARIELKFGAETVSGVIVNAREIPAAENQPAREQLTLLLDSGDLRNLDLGAAAASASPSRNCNSSSRTTWRRWPPRGQRSGAACISIRPTPRSGR